MADLTYISRLETLIRERKDADPATSYVAKSFAKGRVKMAQKIGEEGVELALAAVAEDRQAVIREGADLLFHMLILCEATGICFADIVNELEKREGVSGIAEKQSRIE